MYMYSLAWTLFSASPGEGGRTGAHSAGKPPLPNQLVLDNAIDLMVEQMDNSAQEERRKVK